jgi:hypothetical protein
VVLAVSEPEPDTPVTVIGVYCPTLAPPMAKESVAALAGRARLPATWPVAAPAPLIEPEAVSVLAPVDSTPLVKVSVPPTVALLPSVSEPADLSTVRLLKVVPPLIVCVPEPVKVTVLDCALKLPSPVQLPVEGDRGAAAVERAARLADGQVVEGRAAADRLAR